jgi:hypothetical protein
VSAADYGRQKIAQWGDPFTPPQTRTRCIRYATGKWPWGGEWKTCIEWATDIKTMQVAVFAKVLGPDNLSEAAASAVQDAAKVCAATAAAAAAAFIAGTPSPEIAGRLAAGYAAASETFSGCIGAKASALTTVGVGTAVLKLAFESETFWSKWSNE